VVLLVVVGLCGMFSCVLFGFRLVWCLLFLEVIGFCALVVCCCGCGAEIVLVVLVGVVVSSLVGVVLVVGVVFGSGCDGLVV